MKACLPTLAACLWALLGPAAAQAATYYVAPNGSDLTSGLWPGSPFQTIQKALNVAAPGDTVFVRSGVYREQVEVLSGGGSAGNPVTVQNYNGELAVIKGSDQVTGWLHHNASIWKKTGWTTNSQQVFVDFDDRNPAAGPKPLRQIGMPSAYYTDWEYDKPVGSGLSGMLPGSFYYDPAAAMLYVWLADGSNPNDHKMEASVRRRLFYMGRPYIVLDGLSFRHSNASAFSQQGAAVELSSHSLMIRCDVQFADFAGVSMGYLQSNSQLLQSNVSNNGNSGVVAPASSNFRVAGNTLTRNNYRSFNPLWHAGGFKGAGKTWGNVEYNMVAWNNGSGVWFDYANSGQPIVVGYNYIHGNGPKEAGIFFEASSNGLIHNNLVVNNRRRGIYLSAAANTRVLNNTVAGTTGRAGIELGGMPRAGATLMSNQVVNNIVSHGDTIHDFAMAPANGTTIQGNTSNYNLIHRPVGAIRLWAGAGYSDLSQWRTATGQDQDSISANPTFVPVTDPPSAANYRLQTGSPAIDKGLNLTSVFNRDYLGTPRPTGAGFDIGAFEAGPEHENSFTANGL